MVCFSDGSVGCAADGLGGGLFYGSFRKLCRGGHGLRSIFWMLPKAVPRRGSVAVRFTETSVNRAARCNENVIVCAYGQV